MYCDRCGTRLDEGSIYCRACGHPVAGDPATPREASVAGHVRVLAILWIALSAFRLVPALALFTLGAHMRVPPFVRDLLPVIGFAILGVAVLGFIAAWGLLDRQPWARTLSIAMGVLALIDVPFGTALGIYTLWVLLPRRPGVPGVETEGGPVVPGRT